MNNKVIVAVVASSLALAACSTTAKTTPSSVVTPVVNVATAVLPNSVVSTIETDVAKACGFVPLEQTILAIAGTFSAGVTSANALVNPVVTAICGAVQQSGAVVTPVQSLEKITRANIAKFKTGEPVTVGTVNGVQVTGYVVL